MLIAQGTDLRSFCAAQNCYKKHWGSAASCQERHGDANPAARNLRNYRGTAEIVAL